MVQSLTPFQQSLLPASFGGVPFWVADTVLHAGQRIADHVYPYRDTPYAELMGKAPRQYTFDAFLVGDDVVTQQNNLLSVVERDAYGTLVHPALGELNVACVGAEFTQEIAGRYIGVRLTFVEAGQIVQPNTANDTQAQTINAASSAKVVTNNQFTSDTQSGNLPTPAEASPPTSGSPSPGTTGATPAAESYNDSGDQAVLTDATGFA